MDGARNAVLQLEVHLGNCVFWEYGSVRDITCEINISLGQLQYNPFHGTSASVPTARLSTSWEGVVVKWHTNSSRLNHVADGESLYRLVLGCATRAVAASDRLNVATTLFVSSTEQIISPCTFRVHPHVLG